VNFHYLDLADFLLIAEAVLGPPIDHIATHTKVFRWAGVNAASYCSRLEMANVLLRTSS
jgi:hypothetical protein